MEGKEGIRKKERGGRGKGKGGEGERDGRESLGGKGGEGKRVGKRGGEGTFRGARPTQMFFPRTAPVYFFELCYP